MATSTLLNKTDDAVLFELIHCEENKHIGVATLNIPKALNALNLDMIRLLNTQLDVWADDDTVTLILLKGSGDKAFCAGGDVVSLFNAMKNTDTDNYIETFFTEEYSLDYKIHTYTKPVILWGNGIVMGGGLGLMAAASHKIVTESSRIAMPEITIGLYPDVGGSYFLNQMPAGTGLFLGLTGASINAADAQIVGLADHFINSGKYNLLMDHLVSATWSDNLKANHQQLTEILETLSSTSTDCPGSELNNISSQLLSLSKQDNIQAQYDFILSLDSEANKWLSKAQKSLKHGSPLSACVISKQLQFTKNKTLKECFMTELGMSVQAGIAGEFQEGVRALLVDKDGAPNWKYKNINDVSEQVVDEFFNSKWDADEHPLKNI
jgi:enoyl-CoA hydratase/carnithine racemase